jgi:phospholipid/cholesterol/gamma-HCH transport system substrate-binding protein
MNDESRNKPHYIHRTSYSFQEKLVGIFVLSAAAILIFLLFSLVRQQTLFEEYFEIYGTLKTAEGLGKETVVRVSGVEVGNVSNFEITPNNDIKITLRIFERYHGLIRTDSKIQIGGVGATLFGKSAIEITAGSPDKALIQPGAFLPIQESTSVNDIIAQATTTLKNIDLIVNDVYVLVHNIQPETIGKTLAEIQQASKNIRELTDQINSPNSPIHTVINDPALKTNIQNAGNSLEQATKNFETFAGKLNYDANQVPVILQNIQKAVDETNQTIEATQRIWPISKAIDNSTDHAPLIPPTPAR